MSTRKCRGFATEMVERDREAIRESSWIATARSEATEGPERRFVDGDAAVKAGINATASRHREKGSAMPSKKQPDAQNGRSSSHGYRAQKRQLASVGSRSS